MKHAVKSMCILCFSEQMSWCGRSMTKEFPEMEVQNYSLLLSGCILVCPPPHVTDVRCHSLTVQVHIFGFKYALWIFMNNFL